MAEILTVEQLEALMKDPAALEEHIGGLVEKRIGTVVKDQMSSVLTGKRPPMVDPANPDALGAKLDGKFKRMGEFLTAIHPAVMQQNGMDPRLADYTVAKQLGESDGDAGGFLVPEEFRAELMELPLEQAIIRPRAFTIPMGSASIRIPSVRDTTHVTTVFGGVRAFWRAEAATLTEVEPTFSQIQLIAKKLTGYTRISNELLADSAIAMEALLTRMFGQAIAYFEDDAFINGDGAGEPIGILDAGNGSLIAVAAEAGQAADTIVWENIVNMWARMLTVSKSRAIWLVSPDTFPQLATMALNVGTGGSAVWLANGRDGAPTTILGRPVIETEKSAIVGDQGDIALIDPSFYVIGDRQAVTMAASQHVQFQTDEVVFRFVERLDGQPWVETPLTPRNGGATQSPFVTLAARA